MNRKITIYILAVIILIIIGTIYMYFANLKTAPIPAPVVEPASTTFSYLVSQEDSTKYCNGAQMDSDAYRQTINVEKSATMPEANPSKLSLIKAVLDLATTGACHDLITKLAINESQGTVYIPPIDAWAGISIAMCSCRPQIEINLMRINGITNVVWMSEVASFEDCLALGNPVMESYPRQCRYQDKNFTENIGNELDKANLIMLETPRPNQVVVSPLQIKGKARGTWYFEASFPIELKDSNDKIIAQGIATAKSDWMTEEFVPFEATLNFIADTNASNERGTLILRKDNPSGLPEHEDSLEIPVILSTNQTNPIACTQDAKLCPDGSYVGRSGPNCEFAPCL
jgi:hypothetical protein